MAGTKAGGIAAAKTNLERYGEDYFKRIGSLGGTQTYKSGKLALVSFAARPEDAKKYGAIGGRNSRRNKKVAA